VAGDEGASSQIEDQAAIHLLILLKLKSMRHSMGDYAVVDATSPLHKQLRLKDNWPVKANPC
jgi:hypothetical protein